MPSRIVANFTCLHRVPQCAFSLFVDSLLPLPIGKTLGIIGANDLGKTTLALVLAKKLVPNFGNNEFNKSDLSSQSKNLMQLELSKLQNVLLKPQNIAFKVLNDSQTVDEFLARIDERGVKDHITKMLNLGYVLNRCFDSISGGELQRIAIAIVCVKRASLYIFDEPSSYLDIKQRYNVAKIIKSLPLQDEYV